MWRLFLFHSFNHEFHARKNHKKKFRLLKYVIIVYQNAEISRDRLAPMRNRVVPWWPMSTGPMQRKSPTPQIVRIYSAVTRQ